MREKSYSDPDGSATGVGASDFLGSVGIMGPYDVGTDFVPRTGLALVHKGERITPVGQGGPVVVNMSINTRDANSFRASQGQIAGQMEMALRTARRRNL